MSHACTKPSEAEIYHRQYDFFIFRRLATAGDFLKKYILKLVPSYINIFTRNQQWIYSNSKPALRTFQQKVDYATIYINYHFIKTMVLTPNAFTTKITKDNTGNHGNNTSTHEQFARRYSFWPSLPIIGRQFYGYSYHRDEIIYLSRLHLSITLS